jgi:hypothetical protein
LPASTAAPDSDEETDSALPFQSAVLAQANQLTSADATSILLVSSDEIAANDRLRGWHLVGQAVVGFGGVSGLSLVVAIAANRYGLDPMVTSTLVVTSAGSTTAGVLLRQLRMRGRGNNNTNAGGN